MNMAKTTLIVWFVCIATIPELYSAARLPEDYSWVLDGKERQYKLFVDGSSVVEQTQEVCSKSTAEYCADIQDHISAQFYGNFYTPTRPRSTIEDFHASRIDIVKYVASRYNYKRYLEIGCQSDKTFGNVNHMFEVTVGVDPASGGTHRMTSDDFFAQNTQTFDVIFIDGLHEAHQVCAMCVWCTF